MSYNHLEVPITSSAPHILGCPNKECGSECELVFSDAFGSYRVICKNSLCYLGPCAKTKDEAIRLHNALYPPPALVAELKALAEKWMDTGWHFTDDEDESELARKECGEQLRALIIKHRGKGK